MVAHRLAPVPHAQGGARLRLILSACFPHVRRSPTVLSDARSIAKRALSCNMPQKIAARLRQTQEWPAKQQESHED
jgi:hypothetical protein